MQIRLAADDRTDSSWPWLSPYHEQQKNIRVCCPFPASQQEFLWQTETKWIYTLEWVRLSARHCSLHGYERRDCVNWPRPSIIHLTEHFAYPNEFLVAVGHRGSDNRGSTVPTAKVELICMLEALDTGCHFSLVKPSRSLLLIQPHCYSSNNMGCWLCGETDILSRTYGMHWTQIVTHCSSQPPQVCCALRRYSYNAVLLPQLLFCPILLSL